ncbi:L-threonine O-3-phosphate decarboxylase [Duganella sp. CF517]|uniref:threonine-phosphate decarboxylase CobD n=1 Tax=Duganella sp. CF517 TaxID=1881038 RepID=UPI0008C32642|nr:threonine-phosphate decarboxylase CobD [Duganella sp. CF517]SEO64330.1 L-threonine O-3-phosphate decarboxylase [Duganella sp. CF517]
MLEHGGNLRDAALRFGRDDWLDLSTGINPRWYPAPPLPDNAWHRLPEADPELARAAQAYYNAPLMLPVAGTQAAIQALPRLRKPSRVAVTAPSYAEHAHHWSDHGHTLTQTPYAELDAAVAANDVVVIVNPNNPTGATVPAALLLEWADKLAARGGWLVVDEAFGDTSQDNSVAAHSDRPGLIVLRSVGKFFGLAGIRLGFVAAHADLLRGLADLLGPWTISGPAQHIASAALRDQQWQAATREQLDASGERLRKLLAAHGIASNGTPLFQWWSEARPEAFWQHMAERGIWVRLFKQAARGIRLGLPPDEAGWQRLQTALNEWTNQ